MNAGPLARSFVRHLSQLSRISRDMTTRLSPAARRLGAILPRSTRDAFPDVHRFAGASRSRRVLEQRTSALETCLADELHLQRLSPISEEWTPVAEYNRQNHEPV